MELSKVSHGPDVPNKINVIIEIPAHSKPVKYEVDKATGAMFVDRFMATSMRYPCNYGYIPNTLSEDGDPVDVLVVSPMPLNHGTVCQCRPIGLLNMTDEAGQDVKILAVPLKELTPLYDDVKAPEDLPNMLLEQIAHFFTHYKDLEKGKWVKLDGWLGLNAAKKEIQGSIKRYEDSPNKPAF